MFIDAINVKIRDGQVANRPIYVAMAVTVDGNRDILGIWAGDGGEGAKHWLHVLTELKNRGVADVLMLVCDGLKGLPDAVEAVWPKTIVQTCIVHYPETVIMSMLGAPALVSGGARGCRFGIVRARRTISQSRLSYLAVRWWDDGGGCSCGEVCGVASGSG